MSYLLVLRLIDVLVGKVDLHADDTHIVGPPAAAAAPIAGVSVAVVAIGPIVPVVHRPVGPIRMGDSSR